MADAGLGIYSVAHGAIEAGHDFVFRLSKGRFESLLKKAESVIGQRTWTLKWLPTAKDGKTTPSLKGTHLQVRLHRYITEEGEPIYLVTSLRDLSCDELAQQYRRRYDIETDIRNIKVTMNIERIRATSKEMVLKELYTSMFAYNMVVQFRRQAAQAAGVAARRMSFKGIWGTFDTFLRHSLLVLPADECWAKYQQAINMAVKADVLPQRPGRSCKRAAHPRRPKTTKWQKQQRQKNKKTTNSNTANQLLEVTLCDSS